MKRILSIMLIVVVACVTTMAAVKKTNLKVLYVGGHSDMEIFGTNGDYDHEANAKSIVARTAAWKSYLEQYFTTVKTIQGEDYNYKMSYDYDVTIIDGDPKPLEPRQTLQENGRFSKMVYARYFPDDFDRAIITIADESETVGRRMGVKNDWYCLCLDAHAFNMNTKNAIFKGPYKVSLTTIDRPTPAGVKEYANIFQETMPAKLSMWKVQNKGYITNKDYKVGMVVRPWGYLDSPDTEIISGGESAKCYDAISMGRHANWLHWGFAASPADMTDEAKSVFANAVVYINKFNGHRIIARKLNEGIATRNDADEQKFMLSKRNFDDYAKTIETVNKQLLQIADSLRKVQAAGGEISGMYQDYVNLTEKDLQPIPTYIEYLKQRAGDLYEKFGTDIDKYAQYYAENRPYFYGTMENYELQLDEDAKSLGIANNDVKILDKAISMWENNDDVEKAKRILYHYTLLRYDNAKQWRQWYNTYKSKLFFTESGGWLWLVNDYKAPGNDYSVLKFNEIDNSKLAPAKDKATKEEPVALSYAVMTNGGENELVVRMSIYPGYHIYSYVCDQDPYIQTTYDIKPSEGVQLVGDLQKPAGMKMAGSNSIIYEGEKVLRQKFTGKSGKIIFTVNYQACDAHACLMPQSKTIEVNF